MELFLRHALSRAGADALITPREMIRDYISLLNILMQNPDTSVSELLNTEAVALTPQAQSDPDAVFDPEDIEF